MNMDDQISNSQSKKQPPHIIYYYYSIQNNPDWCKNVCDITVFETDACSITPVRRDQTKTQIQISLL